MITGIQKEDLYKHKQIAPPLFIVVVHLEIP